MKRMILQRSIVLPRNFWSYKFRLIPERLEEIDNSNFPILRVSIQSKPAHVYTYTTRMYLVFVEIAWPSVPDTERKANLFSSPTHISEVRSLLFVIHFQQHESSE